MTTYIKGHRLASRSYLDIPIQLQYLFSSDIAGFSGGRTHHRLELGHSSCCIGWRSTRELEGKVGEDVVGVVVVSLGVSLSLEGGDLWA